MPTPSVDGDTLAGISARAIVVDLPSVPLLPPPSAPSARVYAVVGDPEVAVMAGRDLSSLADIQALILNEREAGRLTGRPDAPSAAAHLASLGATAIVTRGGAGAIAVEPDGRTIAVPALPVDVADATGAGDLFVAAYVWADLAGNPLEDRLRLATRYASLSLEATTDCQKGISLAELRARSSG
jgi:sugar/nucleoside kinase (ribokinase family)